MLPGAESHIKKTATSYNILIGLHIDLASDKAFFFYVIYFRQRREQINEEQETKY